MNGVLSLIHRRDRDVPERIRPVTYRPALLKIDRGTARIHSLIQEVRSAEDDSGVHLEFCLTSYYPRGRKMIYAVWPKYPRAVQYTLVDRRPDTFKGWINFGTGDPACARHDISHDHKSNEQLYLFFGEDPHQPHRPYFFTVDDKIFGRVEQDNTKVIAHHGPQLQTQLAALRSHIDSIKNVGTITNLVALEYLLRDFPTFNQDGINRFLEERGISPHPKAL